MSTENIFSTLETLSSNFKGKGTTENLANFLMKNSGEITQILSNFCRIPIERKSSTNYVDRNQILSLVKTRSMTAREIRGALNLGTRDSIKLRKTLSSLIEENILSWSGQGPSTRYFLKNNDRETLLAGKPIVRKVS